MNAHSFNRQILVRQEKNHLMLTLFNMQALQLFAPLHVGSSLFSPGAKPTIFKSISCYASICQLDN